VAAEESSLWVRYYSCILSLFRLKYYNLSYLSICQMVRSRQPTGVLIPVVYLFGGEESKAKNSKVAHEYAEHREHDELYWFGPPESNTLRPVVGVYRLRIGWIVQWVASSALYWPVDEVGSQTPGRLQPGDLSLHYTSCHIPSICFGRSPPRSCLALYAKS
jgi:hypothetical protein